jgi:NAD(P)-dependent dehydrogenase (short-subunit alcohol dehydrogenase family)
MEIPVRFGSLAGNVFGTTRGAARTLCSWIVDCAGMSLAGDVAIVTGGGDGIGGATARRLAEEGASVLIVEVSELGEQNAAAIRAAGGVAEAVVLDVSKSEDVKAMVQTAVEKFGKVTILVNNACVQSRWPDWWRPHVECDSLCGRSAVSVTCAGTVRLQV